MANVDVTLQLPQIPKDCYYEDYVAAILNAGGQKDCGSLRSGIRVTIVANENDKENEKRSDAFGCPAFFLFGVAKKGGKVLLLFLKS